MVRMPRTGRGGIDGGVKRVGLCVGLGVKVWASTALVRTSNR